MNKTNKKIVIIGGSNGIGLAIGHNLIQRGYFLEICDLVEPDKKILGEESFEYMRCNLLQFDESLFRRLASDTNTCGLIITAGIGRIADFEYLHIAEIEKILTINTTSTIKILSIFYERIKSNDIFFTCVLGSIAGWLSSPAASVYSASKAAVVRFMESINIELEAKGTPNRILDVSPASFKGSRFYGGDNVLSLMKQFANDITTQLFDHKTLFIPQYNEIFKDVITRYHNNPHEYGLHSYEYKKQSDRIDNTRRVIIGYMSGTFDLFHIGHLNVIKRAKAECDYLVVGVYESGKRKGKETFIPFDERKAIVAACKYVDQVVDAMPEDTDIWQEIRYNRLFVGSDYKGSERFQKYEEYFKDKDVKIIYFPYTQSTSSTQLRDKIIKS